MFLFRRHFPSLLEILLMILGLGFLLRGRHRHNGPDAEERARCRTKRREFRRRLRSAFEVFDEEEPAPTANQAQP